VSLSTDHIAHFDMSETAGASRVDAVSGLVLADLVGTVGRTDGTYGYAADFLESSSHHLTSSHAKFALPSATYPAFSIGGLARLDDKTTLANPMLAARYDANDGGGAGRLWHVDFLRSSDKLRAVWSDDGSAVDFVTIDAPAESAWFAWLLRVDASSVRFTVNGTTASSATGLPIHQNAGPLFSLGSYTWSAVALGEWTGAVDYLDLWHRFLTDAEAADYAGSDAGNCWPFSNVPAAIHHYKMAGGL